MILNPGGGRCGQLAFRGRLFIDAVFKSRTILLDRWIDLIIIQPEFLSYGDSQLRERGS